jgi:hypothetical protein
MSVSSDQLGTEYDSFAERPTAPSDESSSSSSGAWQHLDMVRYVKMLTTIWRSSSCPSQDPISSLCKLATLSGPQRSMAGPPHAVVFETKPIAFALRDVVAGVDLDAVPQPGIGAAIWLHATDTQAIHDALVADGRTIVSGPTDGPFGRTFTFADLDGYQVTIHDRP